MTDMDSEALVVDALKQLGIRAAGSAHDDGTDLADSALHTDLWLVCRRAQALRWASAR